MMQIAKATLCPDQSYHRSEAAVEVVEVAVAVAVEGSAGGTSSPAREPDEDPARDEAIALRLRGGRRRDDKTPFSFFYYLSLLPRRIMKTLQQLLGRESGESSALMERMVAGDFNPYDGRGGCPDQNN